MLNNYKRIKTDLGGTNVLSPLKSIFSDETYNEINLRKNIFLLTDGDIEKEKETLLKKQEHLVKEDIIFAKILIN